MDGAAGAVWAPGGAPRVVFGFTIADGKVTGIDLLAHPDLLSEIDRVFLED